MQAGTLYIGESGVAGHSGLSQTVHDLILDGSVANQQYQLLFHLVTAA
jgi:hypothetical protein